MEKMEIDNKTDGEATDYDVVDEVTPSGKEG